MGHLWQAPFPPQEPQSCFSSVETQNRHGTDKEAGEKAFPEEKGGRKDFCLSGKGQLVPATCLSSAHCASGTCHKFS